MKVRYTPSAEELSTILWSDTGELRIAVLELLAESIDLDIREEFVSGLFYEISDYEREGWTRQQIAEQVLFELRPESEGTAIVDAIPFNTFDPRLNIDDSREVSFMRLVDDPSEWYPTVVTRRVHGRYGVGKSHFAALLLRQLAAATVLLRDGEIASSTPWWTAFSAFIPFAGARNSRSKDHPAHSTRVQLLYHLQQPFRQHLKIDQLHSAADNRSRVPEVMKDDCLMEIRSVFGHNPLLHAVWYESRGFQPDLYDPLADVLGVFYVRTSDIAPNAVSQDTLTGVGIRTIAGLSEMASDHATYLARMLHYLEQMAGARASFIDTHPREDHASGFDLLMGENAGDKRGSTLWETGRSRCEKSNAYFIVTLDSRIHILLDHWFTKIVCKR